jgi:hypothetical protein
MSHAAIRKTEDDLAQAAFRASQGERVPVRLGRKTVAVVPIEDLRRLQKLEDEEDLRDIRAARAEMQRKGAIPWEKAKASLGLK